MACNLCSSQNIVPSFWAQYNVSLWLPEVCQQNSHSGLARDLVGLGLTSP